MSDGKTSGANSGGSESVISPRPSSLTALSSIPRYNSSNGATSIIRRRLHFNDEALWKKFTTRRLQLVETLSLSSKKASEQDDQINICARTLMAEFGFPESTLAEFVKLVRLAIQSVRRNKKRSEKRLASKLIQAEQRKRRRSVEEHNEGTNFLSSIMYEENTPTTHHHTYSHDSSSSSSPITSPAITAPSTNKPDDPSVSRLAINSLVSPALHDPDRLPSIRKLNANPEFADAAQKILLLIKRSKTCYEFSCTSGLQAGGSTSYQTYELLEEMGSYCVSSAVLFTLEKWFDHLLLDSASYIKLRLKSDLTLSLVVKNLDSNSVEVNRLSDYVASQLFKKLIGGCVKDFGFDSVLYPLCDIFRGVILKDYPLLSKESKMHRWLTEQQQQLPRPLQQQPPSQPSIGKSPFSLTNEMSVAASKSLTATGLPPILTASRIGFSSRLPPLGHKYTTVIIKFNEQELKFIYSSHSNAPPTLLELITNSRTAFGIADHSRPLRIKEHLSGAAINSDFELEKLFRSDNDHIELELVFASSDHGYLKLNYEKKKETTILPPMKDQQGNTRGENSASTISNLTNFQRLL
ncbi:DEKNAAC101524 [Brettanomyces naardenensis]|uniref:DEKNAAC101524 n=1 Tax=Brettanomyces naardenensis TaxID=13370 RepID=A0A448YI88_BRENA|nr:DEKNAAC101524 [Brettanomyces naardenensis]